MLHKYLLNIIKNPKTLFYIGKIMQKYIYIKIRHNYKKLAYYTAYNKK